MHAEADARHQAWLEKVAELEVRSTLSLLTCFVYAFAVVKYCVYLLMIYHSSPKGMCAAKEEELNQERLDRKAEKAAHAAEVYDLAATIDQRAVEVRLPSSLSLLKSNTRPLICAVSPVPTPHTAPPLHISPGPGAFFFPCFAFTSYGYQLASASERLRNYKRYAKRMKQMKPDRLRLLADRREDRQQEEEEASFEERERKRQEAEDAGEDFDSGPSSASSSSVASGSSYSSTYGYLSENNRAKLNRRRKRRRKRAAYNARKKSGASKRGGDISGSDLGAGGSVRSVSAGRLAGEISKPDHSDRSNSDADSSMASSSVTDDSILPHVRLIGSRKTALRHAPPYLPRATLLILTGRVQCCAID